MVALQVQGFCLILAIFPAPIIPRIGFYGLKYKAFSIIQDTLFMKVINLRDIYPHYDIVKIS